MKTCTQISDSGFREKINAVNSPTKRAGASKRQSAMEVNFKDPMFNGANNQ